MTTMRAIAYTRYGGPEVTQICDLPVPTPGLGEVQVRVAAVGLNPIDWHQRNGDLKQLYSWTFPFIGGNEFSGVISELGKGVTGFTVGDKVICRADKSKLGAMGEYAVASSSIIAKVPSTTTSTSHSASLVDAAGLPLAGLTALQCLDVLEVKAGDNLLITAGAGGVGQYAIQLAKLRGAHVTTTASENGKPFVVKAGADVVVDYRKESLAKRSEKFEKVLDLAGGEQALINDVIPSVSRGGQIVSIAGPLTPGVFDPAVLGWKAPLVNFFLYLRSRGFRNAATARGVKYSFFFMRPDGKQLGELYKLVEQGKLTINIDSRYNMEDFQKAFQQLESGRSKGKVIITFPCAEEVGRV